MKKIIFWLLSIITIIAILIIILFYYIVIKPLPNYKNLRLKGLKDEVEIIIDSSGVPHIYAKNQHDLYYTTGYLMAQERLWQMDLLRRVTTGKLSEIFGKSYVEVDLLLRCLEFSNRSEKIYRNLSEDVKQSLIAFSNGVNEYILKNKNNLSFEFKILRYKPEAWNPIHSLNLIGYMAWDLKSGWNEIILEKIKNIVDERKFIELFQDSVFDKSSIYDIEKNIQIHSQKAINKLSSIFKKLEELNIQIFDASNNWVVSSQKSITGKPILANDMHLSLNIPGIWFQIHQVVKDSLNVIGVAIPGQPLVVCGHNDKIAWGMTNTYVDNVDFYLIKTNDNDPEKYLFNNEWIQMSTRKEKIPLKNNDTIFKEIKFTKFGPIVSTIIGFDSISIAMHWIGHEEGNEYISIYKLNRAKNWHEFNNALKDFIAVSQNIAYADVDGNIGMVCAGGVPVRKRNNYQIILPGDTDEYEWKKVLNIDSLPKIFNPTSELLASANNKTISKFKYHIGNYFSTPYRYERIINYLKNKEKISIEDCKKLQNDEYSTMAELFKNNILKLISDSLSQNPNYFKYLKNLLSWNCEINDTSKNALFFEIFTNHFIRNVFIDELGENILKDFIKNCRIYGNVIYKIYNGIYCEWVNNIKTPKKESIKEIAVVTFKETVNLINDKYIDKNWGDKHKLILKHPMGDIKILSKILKLKFKSISVGGSYHTVKVFSYKENFLTSFGSSNRHIYSLDNWDNSIYILPTGNSGLPYSKFYCNLTKKYIAGEYLKMPYSNDKVKNYSLYTFKFTPEKK